MNVIFHVVAGTAIAAAMAKVVARKPESKSGRRVLIYLTAFATGILIHGLLDCIPHQYPLRTIPDVGFSVVYMVVVAMLVRRNHLVLLGFAFLGSVFPDLIDLGPEMANRVIGPVFPEFTTKVFPWHRPEYSGSIFDGSRSSLSHLLHLTVIAISALAVYASRPSLWRTRGENEV